ncbi:hypothetical protein B566_EDAN002556 [Ephemera danica]|nr:hypothetical protein B566_EDAN002556 [Ephemera danica]
MNCYFRIYKPVQKFESSGNVITATATARRPRGRRGSGAQHVSPVLAMVSAGDPPRRGHHFRCSAGQSSFVISSIFHSIARM